MSYSYSSKFQKYSLDNLPQIDKSLGCVIEQEFLRHIKTGEIPNLEQYLQKLNKYDWTCLLAANPRQEFLQFLINKIPEMQPDLDWEYIFQSQADLRNVDSLNNWATD